jgi:hypothetical protein
MGNFCYFRTPLNFNLSFTHLLILGGSKQASALIENLMHETNYYPSKDQLIKLQSEFRKASLAELSIPQLDSIFRYKRSRENLSKKTWKIKTPIQLKLMNDFLDKNKHIYYTHNPEFPTLVKQLKLTFEKTLEYVITETNVKSYLKVLRSSKNSKIPHNTIDLDNDRIFIKSSWKPLCKTSAMNGCKQIGLATFEGYCQSHALLVEPGEIKYDIYGKYVIRDKTYINICNIQDCQSRRRQYLYCSQHSKSFNTDFKSIFAISRSREQYSGNQWKNTSDRRKRICNIIGNYDFALKCYLSDLTNSNTLYLEPVIFNFLLTITGFRPGQLQESSTDHGFSLVLNENFAREGETNMLHVQFETKNDTAVNRDIEIYDKVILEAIEKVKTQRRVREIFFQSIGGRNANSTSNSDICSVYFKSIFPLNDGTLYDLRRAYASFYAFLIKKRLEQLFNDLLDKSTNTVEQLRFNFEKNYVPIYTALLNPLMLKLSHSLIRDTLTYIDIDIIYTLPEKLFTIKECISMATKKLNYAVNRFKFNKDHFPEHPALNLDYYERQHEIRRYFHIEEDSFTLVKQLLNEKNKISTRRQIILKDSLLVDNI